jgi:hypothetical protein
MRSPIASICALILLSSAPAFASEPVHLFTEKGVPAGWVIGTVKDVSKQPANGAKWFVNDDGILTGTNTYDTWLMSSEEYGDFELELEFKVSALGNSGVAVRAPLHGDPAYDGMELQIVDPRYYEGKGAPEQLCGAIYRAIPAAKDAYKPEDWNRYQITCVGPHVKVVLNGAVVQDFNLDEQTKSLHRDKAELSAPPLKDRPRKGHIGFQDLCRDNGRTQIRNVTLRVLDAADSPADHAWRIDFGGKDALADWTVAGDVAADPAKTDASRGGGALRVGPGGKATLQLRKTDGSGTVEMWVYDDGTTPTDFKAPRVGPRWGLVGEGGRVLAIGSLYNSYLGGNEGFTASANDGKSWFDQLFWLGGNRGKPAWHKWTFNFDADGVIQILCDDKPVGGQIDAAKADMKGFSGIALWGDAGKDNGQSIWVAGPTITLGGPVSVPAAAEVDPYDLKQPGNEPAVNAQAAVVYTKANAPKTPKLEDLPSKSSVSQYGMTWTFDKPAPVGRFVNGDWYVVGPVTVIAIDPKPLYGSEIPKNQLDHMDNERPEVQRVRNGFMLNPPARMKVAYDSGVRNWFDPSLIQKLPVEMKAGDSLVSTVSMPKNLVLHAQLRNKIERGVEDCSPIRTAAVLTCVAGPQPAEAVRPAFCDRRQHIYLARDLRRELLPTAARTASTPDIAQYVRFTERPWVGTCFFGFEEPVENMPQYGLEYGRVVGLSALLLCTDLTPEQKEPLLVNFVQIGIDLGGMVRAGHPGWQCWGGHGSGRKLPIVFAGMLLGDPELEHVNRSFPRASFGEDEQTAYGDAWTGAKVVFAGHSGIDEATGIGRNHGRGEPWGPYEHTPPTAWKDGQNTSESYRRCCTSVGWVAQALALRLMHAEGSWAHDAFFDYVDRWMFENDGDFVKQIKAATGKDFDKDWARQGQCWDTFVNEMWAKYRTTLPAPTDGWRTPHDNSYYQTAIEKGQTKEQPRPLEGP